MQPTPSEVLADFDWKLLYSLASDQIASLKQPTLRLQLSTVVGGNKDATMPREVVLEYNKDELDNLIAELERAQKVGWPSES
mmetsp:Transcript_32269/g.70402  ORF Transcript_32269/g.70402 Transcript_32269/m.70402 type:complete len:82 (-) Transcript_32269:258-503(-)